MFSEPKLASETLGLYTGQYDIVKRGRQAFQVL